VGVVMKKRYEKPSLVKRAKLAAIAGTTVALIS
jgi:hypothetical protein